jgi:hypothetical protein
MASRVLRVDCEAEVEEMKQIPPALESEPSDADRQTRIWRLDQLISLGFDSGSAAELADEPQVDLSQARRLIALGCPLETARRILL